MSKIEGYTLEKTWETPALSRAVDGVLDSHVYMINGIQYFLRIGIPRNNEVKLYPILLCCPEPPEAQHSVTVTVTFLGKKKIVIKGSGILTPSSRVLQISNPMSESTIKSLCRKEKLTLMFSITHKRSETAVESLPDTRSLTGYVGIQNQAATCYLNSVIQLLYHIPAFRRLIYSVETTESDRGQVIHALQRVFCLLQLSPSAPSTKDLTDSFGWKNLEALQQHDAQEFMRIFIDKIEEKLKGTALQDSISSMMSGKSMNRICHPLQTKQSGPNDVFYDIGVRVTGKNSLYSFLTDELKNNFIEDYVLDSGEKVKATLSTMYSELPPVLFFHLNRFNFTTRLELVNEPFEYPETLDMKDFCTDEYEGPTEYELFSVIVHIGDMVAGHYFCYCRPSLESKWFRFNDTAVDVVPADQVMTACNRHAYYLCYIRKSDISTIMNPVKDEEIPQHLIEFYESVRESLDFSIIPLNVLNSEKTRVILKKNKKVSDLIREISKRTKEVWAVDNNKLPIRLLKPSETLQEVLTPNAFVYSHDSDSSQIVDPVLLELEFFSPGLLTKHSSMAFSRYELIRSAIPKVCERLGLPPQTQLVCFDCNGKELALDKEFASQGLTKGRIIFQMVDTSIVPSFQVEELKEGLVRMRDFMPELPLKTVSSYIAHVRSCIHIHVKPSNFILEVSHLATVKILIILLRKYLQLTERQGIELYREENSVYINSMQMSSLKDALAMNGDHYQFRETSLIYRVVDTPQESINNMIQLNIPLYNAVMDQIGTKTFLLHKNETIRALLDSVETPNGIKRVVQTRDRVIVKVFSLEDPVSELHNKEIRIEEIPEDQLHCQAGEFLVRASFTCDSIRPQRSLILTPLFIKVVPNEPIDIALAKIMSLFEEPLGIDHVVLEHSQSYKHLESYESLSDYATKDDLVYLVINTADVYRMYGIGNNKGIQIKN